MPYGKTIAAISTPPGKGGVAVIRISGDEALAIAKSIFIPRFDKSAENPSPRRQIYGDIVSLGEQIDDGLLCYFPAPNSYTGEDIIEISCHGGILVSKAVLEACFIAGAEPAEKGEFTKRAFINGRLTLTETEGVSMLLEAESTAQLRLSREKSRSKLRAETEGIRGKIVSLLSSIYARIDYPDEDLGELSLEQVIESLDGIESDVDRLLSTYKTGRAVSLGVCTVICGKPNVGKSTLYNLLLGEEAAIVTDIPGTTRDVLEKSLPLGDVLLKLSDTAGIRASGADAVENIGIDRSYAKLGEAELILFLSDSESEPDLEDGKILEFLKELECEKIGIITKSESFSSDAKAVEEKKALMSAAGIERTMLIDAKEKGDAALAELSKIIAEIFTDEKISIGNDAIVSSARQHSTLVRAKEHIAYAKEALLAGLACDAASADIELAFGAIAELDGRAVSEEVVSDIFAKFCVGK